MRVSSHDISYNARIIWIARARPDIFRPWKTGSNKIPASDKTLFVPETCSARARYVLITPRVTRSSTGVRSRLMHEHAFVRGARGSYILIIHLRNQDVAFVKINLGRFSCKYNWFYSARESILLFFYLSLSLSRVDVVSIFFERTACTFTNWVIREHACYIKYAGRSLNVNIWRCKITWTWRKFIIFPS